MKNHRAGHIRWSIALVAGIGFFGAILLSQRAEALAQWTRKYGVACQTCHNVFPRVNFFGEQFKLNGYQMPDSQDGNETKEKTGDVWYDKIGNLLGVRISVTPIRAEANQLQSNGGRSTRLSFGNTDWVQFFTGGSIFKNASIFIETEIMEAEAELNWFVLGYHNLFDSSLLNVRVGRISPMDHLSQSGRVRMIPSIRIQSIAGIESGGGFSTTTLGAAAVHNDAVPLASPQPSVELYGYRGPILYSVGVTNGDNLVDTNKFKNFFGTLKLTKQEGDLAGSNISAWGYQGWDTANEATARITDRFWRTAGSANLRYGKWDLIGLFVYGKDDNWDFATGVDQTSKGASGQAGYRWTDQWFTALQYDWVNGTDGSDNFNRVSPALTFQPVGNMRIDLVGRFDMNDTAGGRRHEGLINVRSMF